MTPITLINASLSSDFGAAAALPTPRVPLEFDFYVFEFEQVNGRGKCGGAIRICRWSFGAWVPGAPSSTSLFEVRQNPNLTIENSELVQRGGPSSTAFFASCWKLREERSQTRNKTGLFASDFEAEDSPWRPMQTS